LLLPLLSSLQVKHNGVSNSGGGGGSASLVMRKLLTELLPVANCSVAHFNN